MFFRYARVPRSRYGAAGSRRDLWFTAPPRMAELPVPEGGEPFEVECQGHVVRGLASGADGIAGRST